MSKPKHPIGPQTYQPEIWQVRKDVIYAAITAIKTGLEHTEYRRMEFKCIGLQLVARTLDERLAQMERTLEMLRGCGPEAKEGE